MGQGFADVWALMRCWRLAAGLPSAVVFGYRTLRTLDREYEAIIAPIVVRTITDLSERAQLVRALKAASMKVGTIILNYARMTDAEPRQDIAAIAGAISRLYDDLIEASPDASRDGALADLFYAVPCAASSDLELLLARLAEEIRQRVSPLPGTVVTAFDALHEYQCLSRLQREVPAQAPVVGEICRGKGAMAHLTVCSLLKPEIGDDETELVMALGVALQSLDDYADVDYDKRDGIATLAALGVTTLADMGTDVRALRDRLTERYGRIASRRYCGLLLYLLAINVMGRWLPAVVRLAGRFVGRDVVLTCLARGPNAVSATLPLREDA